MAQFSVSYEGTVAFGNLKAWKCLKGSRALDGPSMSFGHTFLKWGCLAWTDQHAGHMFMMKNRANA